jgi:hypothetical protein
MRRLAHPGPLHGGIDDAQQSCSLTVDGDEDDMLPFLPEAFRPAADGVDRKAKRRKPWGIGNDDDVAVTTGRQCEQLVIAPATDCYDRHNRLLQHW